MDYKKTMENQIELLERNQGEAFGVDPKCGADYAMAILHITEFLYNLEHDEDKHNLVKDIISSLDNDDDAELSLGVIKGNFNKGKDD